ncbi:MAG: putative RDD family membrane protein YckC [Flavobacterium sp.]|jgi:uncharacterized RDD family membrane protein YckC
MSSKSMSSKSMSSKAQLLMLLRRLFSTLIDMVLVPSLALFIMWVTGVLEHAEDFAGHRPVITALLLGVVSYLILNAWLLMQRGQTIGKALLGISIVLAVDGGKVPIWRLICIRALFFPLLYLTMIPWFILIPILDQILIFGKNRRCLHDYVSGTQVTHRL